MYTTKQFHKIYALIIITFFLIIPSIIAMPNPTIGTLKQTRDLNLLRVEHYLELEAVENTDAFHVHFVCPPDYGYQVPIIIEIYNDTTANLLDYTIQKDSYCPNQIINFSLSSMKKDQHELIHFAVWVLVESHDFFDVPIDIPIPDNQWENPEESRQWLSKSDVVQRNHFRIKHTANKLEGRDDTIYTYAKNISCFILNHRHTLFLIQLWTKTFFTQDAITTLKINGENVGRAHLACALFRTKNIPARVLLVHNDQGFWTQMHYMVEYYIPSYGWVLLDPTYGQTPYPTNKQVINRICSIEDEDDTKNDYIYRFMKGLERWIWIDTEHVKPYYIDCDHGSKSQMFTEIVLEAPLFAADYVFFRTQNVFSQYQKYLNKELLPTDQQHLHAAMSNQLLACNKLKNTHDLNEYVFYIEKAFDEYKLIE